MHRIHYHFGVVLGLILLSIGFQLAAGESDFARLATVILQAITLIAAVVASRVHPMVVRLAVIAAVLSIIGASLAILGTDTLGDNSGRAVTLLLVALVPPAIITGLIKLFREEGSVTIETMFGGLCLYLIVGLFFGSAFAAIEEIGGHAFFHQLTAAQSETNDFLYFSFTTLTTVGYGDLTAASNFGRSLAITEALIGQIYLVTVVAVIISNMRPARPRPPRRDRTV
ncbi:MAG TPA: potassium channel family protein [Solirubrobacterales bacterium]|nr:potassium channel family protein [Solirubrobacterales bacterium]